MLGPQFQQGIHDPLAAYVWVALRHPGHDCVKASHCGVVLWHTCTRGCRRVTHIGQPVHTTTRPLSQKHTHDRYIKGLEQKIKSGLVLTIIQFL